MRASHEFRVLSRAIHFTLAAILLCGTLLSPCVEAQATATLRFDSASGPTAKSIVHDSGTLVTFAWTTQGLPSGTTCKILWRPNETFYADASPVSGGTRTDANIQGWPAGPKLFYLSCSNGVVSPDITLTISNPPTVATATLLFDSIIGPTTKTIVRNSGTLVKFAWTTQRLPSGTTCKILLRPNDGYNAAASPVASGTRTDANIHTWGVGQKRFYLRCSNGVISPDITLTISNTTAPATATLRFDSANGPTAKTIIRNSGTPVTFAWATQNLPSGTTCKTLLRPNDSYNAAASPVSGGTRTDANIHTWGIGQKLFYLRCSNGTVSPDITLTITGPAPTATLRFDSAAGPTAKTIVRNSGTPVTFAWTTQNLPSGTTCRIYLRPNDSFAASASPVSGGTRTETTIHAWGIGQKPFYLRCSNGVVSPDITLTISNGSATYLLSVQRTGEGAGTVTSSPAGIHCGSTCSAGFAAGTTVTLTAIPTDENSVFTGWTGACGGTTATCTVTMNAARSVEAVFARLEGSVRAISAGQFHTCALTSAGAVRCWGYNGEGELGDGTGTNRLTPVPVSGLPSDVQAISAGTGHTCALTGAGAVWCWGSNSRGQLGDGTTTDRLAPVPVSSLSGDVLAIDTGGSHTCALTRAGAVWCWGSNGNGQLGDGTTTHRRTPVPVAGLSSGVLAIGVGGGHSCAVTSVGAVQCWGYNGTGQLGDGTTTSRLTPTMVSALPSGVQAISVGNGHTCVMAGAGTVWCWGRNDYGQLGDGTTALRLTPVRVSGLSSDVQAISTGSWLHTCAVTSVGAAWCWGYNSGGQLGDGTTTRRLMPVAVSGLSSDVRAISAGGFHTCAVIGTGVVLCWGFNGDGELGDGTTTTRLTPVPVWGLDGD